MTNGAWRRADASLADVERDAFVPFDLADSADTDAVPAPTREG
jgi:hypothetical protein